MFRREVLCKINNEALDEAIFANPQTHKAFIKFWVFCGVTLPIGKNAISYSVISEISITENMFFRVP